MSGPAPLRLYIGYDPREDEAYRVCAHSLRRRASRPLDIRALDLEALRGQGLYARSWHRDGSGQRIDDRDGKPFSTDFAFSRFLVPALARHEGWALFCDCDFLFLADVAALFALRDPRYAVQCVQHDHRPAEPVKMDGQAQTRYARKNWSSLVLWNCAHPAHGGLTVQDVSRRPGSWLHGLRWLDDDQIGALPEGWNWLDGWSPLDVPAQAVHFTRGGPWFPNHEPGPYSAAWLAEREVLYTGETGASAAPALDSQATPLAASALAPRSARNGRASR
jgi:hypothetical protein